MKWISVEDSLPKMEDFNPLDLCYFDGSHWQHYLGIYVDTVGFIDSPSKEKLEQVTYWKIRFDPTPTKLEKKQKSWD